MSVLRTNITFYTSGPREQVSIQEQLFHSSLFAILQWNSTAHQIIQWQYCSGIPPHQIFPFQLNFCLQLKFWLQFKWNSCLAMELRQNCSKKCNCNQKFNCNQNIGWGQTFPKDVSSSHFGSSAPPQLWWGGIQLQHCHRKTGCAVEFQYRTAIEKFVEMWKSYQNSNSIADMQNVKKIYTDNIFKRKILPQKRVNFNSRQIATKHRKS